MNFSAALEAMKAGKKVSRPSKSFETYRIGQFPLDEPGTKTDIIAENGIFKKISVFGSEGILAEDWEIEDEYPKVKLFRSKDIYYQCPKCRRISEQLVYPEDNPDEIKTCRHCRHEFKFSNLEEMKTMYYGEVINQKDPDANDFKTVISGEPRILFYKGNDLETWYEVEMIPDDIQKHIQKIKDFESAHIKTENVEYDEEKGELTFQIVPIPRGMKIRINDLNRTPSEIDANINIGISKASYWLKEAAIKDVMEWIKESKIKANVQGIDLFFESGVPENMILMNHFTFLTFKEMIEK